MPSLQGHLLVASPHLEDPNFARSVVLIVQHEAEGALGVVLNRPSGKTVADVWSDLTGNECDSDEPIYVGGPLQGPLMAVHTLDESGELQIVPGLWFATKADHINRVVEGSQTPYRLFSGYSGWGGGQLDGEMKAGGWRTTDATASYIFTEDNDALWQTVVRHVGTDILRADQNIRQWPDDPSLN